MEGKIISQLQNLVTIAYITAGAGITVTVFFFGWVIRLQGSMNSIEKAINKQHHDAIDDLHSRHNRLQQRVTALETSSSEFGKALDKLDGLQKEIHDLKIALEKMITRLERNNA